MEKTEKKKKTNGKPGVYWIRLEMRNKESARSMAQQTHNITEDLKRHIGVKDAQLITDVGLINLIGAGIQEAFTDAAEGGEEGGEA